MFTHSIGIVTVIGQPNADNELRIRASRVRTKVLRLLRDRQLQASTNKHTDTILLLLLLLSNITI